jgi:hypothetical protein
MRKRSCSSKGLHKRSQSGAKSANKSANKSSTKSGLRHRSHSCAERSHSVSAERKKGKSADKTKKLRKMRHSQSTSQVTSSHKTSQLQTPFTSRTTTPLGEPLWDRRLETANQLAQNQLLVSETGEGSLLQNFIQETQERKYLETITEQSAMILKLQADLSNRTGDNNRLVGQVEA